MYSARHKTCERSGSGSVPNAWRWKATDRSVHVVDAPTTSTVPTVSPACGWGGGAACGVRGATLLRSRLVRTPLVLLVVLAIDPGDTHTHTRTRDYAPRRESHPPYKRRPCHKALLTSHMFNASLLYVSLDVTCLTTYSVRLSLPLSLSPPLSCCSLSRRKSKPPTRQSSPPEMPSPHF